ncbi:MAG: SAM-dependent methyltransferase [Alphaproteobacteria bacterium]
MTPLETLLARRIASAGPMTLAQFMAEALGHPRYGYYMRRDPFGVEGDFVTAPEISQMFGELIGLWVASVWHQMGEPTAYRLVELGPGRGTLMADALRALALDDRARRAADVRLVETSPALAALQRARLDGVDAAWHESVAEVPRGPLIVIANEVFDALPVHQIERTPKGWRERMIGLDGGDRLRLALAPGPTPASAFVEQARADRPLGTVVEIGPAAIALADVLARRVAADGGAALIIDFGDAEPPRLGSLQAVRDHRRSEVLDSPGNVDLAAAVDFGALARAAREAGARAFGPIEQGAFLRALGIEDRASRLSRGATPDQRAAIDAALHRLVVAEAMGCLFKAFVIAHPALAAPAGFAEPCR